ncbi:MULTISPECIES: hypothetical protein [unclassified Francisella]|uniref:hypothetical protein n=1 Tax=unclassified Francisella TaxID=2610885 RepID=UPI002E36646D|nr:MULTISPECIES: hypothetical protein [unclassified Francisella]MED7818615.1 hypothetical protein [Francisella sp. 19S2-4]MED7829451.1 hypothetical protein [Francisella sp. 19S2-10]
MIYEICGLKYDINTINLDESYSTILSNELELYKIYTKSSEENTISLNIESVDDYPYFYKSSLCSPSIMEASQNYLIIKNGSLLLQYVFNSSKEVSEVNIYIKKTVNNLKKLISKFINIQFTSHAEAIGQFIHELVFIPISILSSSTIAVHASSIYNPQTNVVNIFGGTGGVGKSSTLLEHAHRYGVESKFLADDFTILNSDGDVVPNYAYPKVYGYNLVGKFSEMVSIKGLFNNFSWMFRRSVFGENRVRRRVSPKCLMGTDLLSSYGLSKCYYILLKYNIDNITVVDVDIDKAAEISWNIVQNEYNQALFNYLVWCQLEIFLDNKTYIPSLAEVENNYKSKFKNVFKEMPIKVIKIPKSFNHEQVLSNIISEVENI